eukprot:jgi/Ulvmu1/9098/UM005_0193.1
MAGEDGGQAPKFKLPSFKDVRKQNTERAQLRSNFGTGHGSSATAASHSSSSAGVGPAGHPTPGAGQNHTRPQYQSAGVAARPAASVPSAPFPPGATANLHHSAAPPRPALGNGQMLAGQASGYNGSAGPSSAAARPAYQARPPALAAGAYTSHVTQGNAILVNGNQRGNPVLKYIRNVNYRFADVVPDFQFNDKVRPSDLSTVDCP